MMFGWGVSAVERAAPLGPALEREVQCSRRSPRPPAPGAKARKDRELGGLVCRKPAGQDREAEAWGLEGEKAGGELMLGRRDRVP